MLPCPVGIAIKGVCGHQPSIATELLLPLRCSNYIGRSLGAIGKRGTSNRDVSLLLASVLLKLGALALFFQGGTLGFAVIPPSFLKAILQLF